MIPSRPVHTPYGLYEPDLPTLCAKCECAACDDDDTLCWDCRWAEMQAAELRTRLVADCEHRGSADLDTRNQAEVA